MAIQFNKTIISFCILLLISACASRQQETTIIYVECTEDGSVCRSVSAPEQPNSTPTMNIDGSKMCSSTNVCPEDQILPPEPCTQPMPTYYSDVTELEKENAIILMHPITRTQIVCYDTFNRQAADCVQNFQTHGYVLITDIPQFSANYDIIQKNTYPTRRWRNGGEIFPRW